MTRATLEKDPDAVSAMFDQAARRYDSTNTLLSGGLDRGWRAAARRALDPAPGELCLDLAAGTGVSTVELARSGARTVGVDRSLGMLRAGAAAERRVPLLAGDALALPFADGVFDAVTVMFGLRNVVDTEAALRELARVTRPGGRLVVCEFSHPTRPLFRAVYFRYLTGGLPRLARWASANPDAYTYLAETIAAWPGRASLARTLAGAGWSSVAWRDLTGGVVALHRAVRSPAPAAATSSPAPRRLRERARPEAARPEGAR